MKLLGKKLYRIRPIKLSKGGFGGGPATGGMDFSKILPPAPPPLGERAQIPENYPEIASTADFDKFQEAEWAKNGKPEWAKSYEELTVEEKIERDIRNTMTTTDMPPPHVFAQRSRDLRNRIRQKHGLPPLEIDPNSPHPAFRPGQGTTEPFDTNQGYGPGINEVGGNQEELETSLGERPKPPADEPVEPTRPLDGNYAADPGRPLPPGFVDEPEFGFLMPDDKPGYEITPDPVPPGRYEQGWNKPVEEMQWGSHDPFGDDVPGYTPRPPNMVEKPSGIVQPDLEAGLGDTKPGLSNWVSPIDDGRVDAPGYVVGGGESPQPSPGGGAGEIEKLRAQIKQLQATIAELRSKQQQPASRPPEQAPRPEMPMGGGFGGGGFFGR